MIISAFVREQEQDRGLSRFVWLYISAGQHYLTGMYYISKVTDYISTQGFVKTLRIIKNTASKLASGVELDGKMDFDTISSISTVDSIAATIRAMLQQYVNNGQLTEEQANIIANIGVVGPKTDEQKEKEEAAVNQLNKVAGVDSPKKVYENDNYSYRNVYENKYPTISLAPPKGNSSGGRWTVDGGRRCNVIV